MTELVEGLDPMDQRVEDIDPPPNSSSEVEQTTYFSSERPPHTDQQDTKETLGKQADILLKDATAAMEEMKRRAQRYNEKPQNDQMVDTGGLEVTRELAIYEKAFASHPTAVGKAISKKEREDTGRMGMPALVYGEITFEAFAVVLDKIKSKYGLPGKGHSGPEGVVQDPGGVFYDIGSGTGKPVISAAILHPFSKSVGVEILEGLYMASLEVKRSWEEGIREEVGHDTEVGFILGDALDLEVCDWSGGDVVFANSTCFDDSLMRRLASAATAMRKGSFFVSLTKRLPSSSFTVLEHNMYHMSWGGATIYISQKTTEPFCDPE